MSDVQEKRLERFSYSKLSAYEACGWRYKLQYVDKHFIDSSSIANEFGTLVHYVEETIAKDIIANDNEPNFMIDDEKYIDLFINADIHDSDKTVLGIKKLKEKYPEDFYVKDKSGMDYNEKANDYLNNGIYRLRDYLTFNRNLRVVGIEQPFTLEYGDYIFQGFIDRVYKDISTGEYIVEDIKTWWNINGHDIVTPLQFVFYTLAAEKLYNTTADNIRCQYELPLAHDRYDAGTKGFIKRGTKKIDKLLNLIKEKDFEPNPSPLCHWCIFSKTYPNQPDAAKNLCPYYCKWTKDKKDFSKEFEWMGIENHAAILEAFIAQNEKTVANTDQPQAIKLDPIPLDFNNSRITFIRRR